MKEKYCRVLVTNVVSDEIIELAENIFAHKVVCDCTVEGSEFTEKSVCRIFSHKEYDDVLKYGFYYVEALENNKR